MTAEQLRRAGQPAAAADVCREALARFPGHLSMRVTLGWALLDQGQFREAREAFELVRAQAPDNLAAIRGLAELHTIEDNQVYDDFGEFEESDARPAEPVEPVTPITATAPTSVNVYEAPVEVPGETVAEPLWAAFDGALEIDFDADLDPLDPLDPPETPIGATLQVRQALEARVEPADHSDDSGVGPTETRLARLEAWLARIEARKALILSECS